MLSPVFTPSRTFPLTFKVDEISDQTISLMSMASMAGFDIPVLSTYEKILIFVGLFGVYSIFCSILSVINFVLFLPFTLLKLLLRIVLWVLYLPLRIMSIILQTPYFAFTIIHAIGVLGFGGTLWYITTGVVGAGAGVAYFCPLKRKKLWFEFNCTTTE